MATIIKRQTKAGISYQARIRIKGDPPVSASFTRLTDVKRWASSTESKLREGKFTETIEARKHTGKELIDRYIRDVLPSKKDSRNKKRYLEFWKTEIGAYTLDRITPAVLVKAQNSLVRTPVDWKNSKRIKATLRSSATVNRYMAAISHVFTKAVREWQWMDSNPVRRIEKKEEPKGRVRFLDDDERERLLRVCREMIHPFLYTAVVVSLSTGARRGEILGLRWKDVDLKNGKITLFDTKNGDIRPIPLRGLALELVHGLDKNRTKGASLVFPGRPNRKTRKLGPIDLRAPWLKALSKAEIQDFRWHDLRHNTASYLAMNGATLAEIAAVLVLSDIN